MASANPYAEHVKTARSHLRRLATIERHLLEMSEHWGGLDTWVMSLLEVQAEQISKLSKELADSVNDWKRGTEWEE
ncbi:hypothetical protein I6L58_20325 [Enterobacter cancerogenus]|uniref:Uncharacterized protein n=1 Tax=Enterobacter cancerogenus TaxID=69218 RepID=A0ABX8KLV4_9ENTR|nr:hypothetical protein [Enterobacter cancerogenus]QXA49010.1 hypothetical protein I6L58_20325 [Enterobacter cancerogenus]